MKWKISWRRNIGTYPLFGSKDQVLKTSSPPVIEYDLHGCDDDGDGDDEEDGEADVQVLSDPGKLLPVRNVRFI